MPGVGQCSICGVFCKRKLCKQHRKTYRFVKKYNFFALKPKRSISEGQTKLFKNIRAIIEYPVFQEVSFEFCPYSRYDIVVPDRNLIVEFDGEQHFKYIPLFHKSKEGFEEYKEKTIFKESAAKKEGYILIRFSYVNDVGDKEYVRKVLNLKLA